MAHQRAPGADSDLDDFRYYVARESGALSGPNVSSSPTPTGSTCSPETPGWDAAETRPGLRSFPLGQYVIIYHVENEDVVILHVFHGDRDVESFFRQ